MTCVTVAVAVPEGMTAMADRRVTRTGKDSNGNITSLCNSSEGWSPRYSSAAIDDIESGRHTYHVQWPEKRTEVRVVNGRTGKYLRTDRDDTTKNNLDDLPDC